tara:strand:- start:11 stop:445 length:435 start_codon:yes stop_codon:yes gene_type:complete
MNKPLFDDIENIPTVDSRKKPIDLNDMPEDMNTEIVKIALLEIIEAVLEKYKDGNLEAKSLRHNIASEVFKRIVDDGWYLNLNEKAKVDIMTKVIKSTPEYKKGKQILSNLDTVKEAVDLAIGDDGFRSKEVIEILKQMHEEEE